MSNNFYSRQFFILIMAVLIFCVCVRANPESDSSGSESQSQLRQDLWELVSSLRKLRQQHYTEQTAQTEKLKQIQDQSAQLQSQVEQLKRINDDLDKNLQKTAQQITQLQSENQTAEAKDSTASKKLDKFISDQAKLIEQGIPYRQQQRLDQLGVTGDSSGKQPQQEHVSDRFARVWNFSQEELRIATSGQTYTDQVRLDNERLSHARLFRVGHLILGYITEQDSQAGIWFDAKGFKTVTGPQADSVTGAVNILDRKQPPQYIQLPVTTKPVKVTEGDKKK